jgi:hypothetical protein
MVAAVTQLMGGLSLELEVLGVPSLELEAVDSLSLDMVPCLGSPARCCLEHTALAFCVTGGWMRRSSHGRMDGSAETVLL